MRLRHATVKVRPAVNHPRYYDWQFGFLSIWLFGDSDDDVIERATVIVAQLPYERVGESIVLGEPEPDIGGVGKFRQAECRAREVGLALQLNACATGVDEGDFENMDTP